MKYRTLSFFVIACVLLLVSASAMAGSGKQIGTTGASELLIPVGARSTALSGSNIAMVQGIDAVYWNPAGASVMDSQAEAVLSYQNYLADINVTYFGALTNLGAVGNFGMNIKALSFGDIKETTVDNPDGTGSVFSPSYITMGLHFSRKFTDRIHFGVNAKVVSEKIMSVSATGFGADLGLQYINDATGLRLGVVLANFGTSMKFEGSDLEYTTQLPGTEAGSTEGSFSMIPMDFDLPTQLKIGVGYGLDFADNAVDLSGTFVNNSSAFDQYIIGAEYSFKDMFFLRGSYSLAYKQGVTDESDGFVTQSEDYLFGPAFGAGFKLATGGVDLKFDYAYQTTEFFSDTQWFGFTFGF